MKSLILQFFFCASLSNLLFSQINDSKPNRPITEKQKKRMIHPKARYLTFSGGFGFTSTWINDPNKFIQQGLNTDNNTYLPNISYEHGLHKGFFAEIGSSLIGHGLTYKRMVNGNGSSSYLGFHNHIDVQFGLGYRILLANNLIHLNIHGGMFSGFALPNDISFPIDYLYQKIDPITQINYNIRIQSDFFKSRSFGSYLGLSKEVRLSHDVRFFVRYAYRFGWQPILKGTFTLSSDELEFKEDEATFRVSGGGSFITGGLKIQIMKKKLKKYEN